MSDRRGNQGQNTGGTHSSHGRNQQQSNAAGQATGPNTQYRAGAQNQQAGNATQAEESVTDILSEESGKRFLKYIVGVYAMVAVGYGIGLVLLNGIGGDAITLIGYAALFVPILGAPIISMATGMLTGLRLETDRNSAALTSGVGAFLGFIVLLFIIMIFAGLVANSGSSGGGSGGGGDGGNLSDFLGPLFAFGTGVAATGAGTTYIVKRIGI